MGRIRATSASVRRHLRLIHGDPSLVAQAVAVPLVLLVLCALMFGGWGDEWPVAVVDDDRSDASRELVGHFERSRSDISPYFAIIERNQATAQRMIEAGRLQLVVEIPEGFGAGAESPRMLLHNVNSDATKNLRLRVDKVLNAYDHERGALPLTSVMERVRDDDVPRAAFIGGSVALITILLGGALIAANLYAAETEGRTIKEVLMSPLGITPYPVSCLVTGTAGGLVAAIPAYLVAWAVFGLSPAWEDLGAAVVLMGPLSVCAAGVGVLTAQVLRRHRTIQPVLILLAIMTFFVGGGFVGADALPPLARQLVSWWPPTRVFEWGNPLLHGFTDLGLDQLAWVYSAAAAGVALAWWAGRRELASQLRGG